MGPVKKRYLRYAVARDPYLRTARKCAELTIPSLLSPEGKSRGMRFKTPFQSVGARGVNNLAAKLLMTLFPPNASFFRLSASQFQLQQLLQDAVLIIAKANKLGEEETAALYKEREEAVNRDLERKLADVEKAVMREFELLNNRSTDSEALKHLIVAGNVLRYCPPDTKTLPRIFTLENYVVKRDPDGRLLEIITREGVVALTIDPNTRAACGIGLDDESVEKTYDLFTHIRRANDEKGEYWAVEQELNGYTVPGSEGTYEIDRCPWLALRWTKVDGEDYGRGHVEEYLGSLISLEGLSESLLHGAAAASRVLVMVNTATGTGTKIKDVSRAKNGAVIPGNAADVTFLKSDKYHDLRTPAEQIQKLTQELYHAFLVTAAIQRDAERVTSTEIRLMAQELETALGGTYTTLGNEYQRPIAVSHIASMQSAGTLPELPPGVEPVILTGMEALGRNADMNRLLELVNFIKAIVPPEEITLRLLIGGIISRFAASVGISIEGLLRPEEEVEALKQQQAQAAQQQMMIERLGPQAVQAGAHMMQQEQPQ